MSLAHSGLYRYKPTIRLIIELIPARRSYNGANSYRQLPNTVPWRRTRETDTWRRARAQRALGVLHHHRAARHKREWWQCGAVRRGPAHITRAQPTYTLGQSTQMLQAPLRPPGSARACKKSAAQATAHASRCGRGRGTRVAAQNRRTAANGHRMAQLRTQRSRSEHAQGTGAALQATAGQLLAAAMARAHARAGKRSWRRGTHQLACYGASWSGPGCIFLLRVPAQSLSTICAAAATCLRRSACAALGCD